MGLTIPTYIRTTDVPKYLSISQQKGAWSEFIHNALNQHPLVSGLYEQPEPGIFDTGKPAKALQPELNKIKPIKTPKQAKKAVEKIPKDEDWGGPLWKKGKK